MNCTCAFKATFSAASCAAFSMSFCFSAAVSCDSDNCCRRVRTSWVTAMMFWNRLRESEDAINLLAAKKVSFYSHSRIFFPSSRALACSLYIRFSSSSASSSRRILVVTASLRRWTSSFNLKKCQNIILFVTIYPIFTVPVWVLLLLPDGGLQLADLPLQVHHVALRLLGRRYRGLWMGSKDFKCMEHLIQFVTIFS